MSFSSSIFCCTGSRMAMPASVGLTRILRRFFGSRMRSIRHRGHDIAEKLVGQVGFESRRALVGAVGEGEVLRKEDQFGGGDSRLLNHGDGLFKPRAAQHDPDRTGQSGVVGVIEADGRNAAAGRAVARRPRRLGGELSGPRPRAVDRDGEFA